MKFTGKLVDVSIDYLSRKPKITFIANETEILEQIDEIKTLDKICVDAKKYRQKRSLDAHAYCWTLLGKIAIKMKKTSLEVYRKAISEAGVYEIIPIKNEAVDRYIEIWQGNGLGWICEKFPSKLEGFTNVRAFYGSSVYDTAEMSRLIDYIITDCKELGIETEPKEYIDNLLKEWKTK